MRARGGSVVTLSSNLWPQHVAVRGALGRTRGATEGGGGAFPLSHPSQDHHHVTTMTDTTTPTPPKRPRKLTVNGGRLVYTSQGNGRRSFKSWLTDNEDRTCDWKHCGRARHKMSRWCIQHARTYERTGHPTAPAVRFGTWKPYLHQAERFIAEQQAAGHPGITAALQWCAEELLHKGPVPLWADPTC